MSTPAPFSTKDRILGAAEELFAQHGYAGASMRMLARAARPAESITARSAKPGPAGRHCA